MKSPKGFKGKYFCLAAITATVSAAMLQAQAASLSETVSFNQEYETDTQEEKETQVDETPVVVISKKIASEKSSIISANKTPTSPTNLTDNVSIISAKELSLKGATTIKDALQNIPGISINQNGSFGQTSSFFLQGMDNKYTLVLVDGVSINDPSNISGANLSHLMLNEIERIEIIKGAQSGVWGANAAAGVINIITKEPEPGLHGFTSLELGSYGYKYLTTGLSYKTHLSDIAFNVGKLETNGPSAQAPKGENIDQYEDDPYYNTTLQIKLGHWIDSNNRIEASIKDVDSKVEYDGWGDPNSSEYANYKQRQVSANYQHYHNAHTITLSASKSKFKSDYIKPFSSSQFRGDSQEIELKDRFRYSNSGLLLFGASFGKDVAKSGSDKKSSKKQAAFINHTYTLDSWVFNQAFRYDSYELFDNEVTGKLGVSYLFDKNFKIYANAGTAYRAPNIINMLNPWGLSNFDLNPESIQSYNVGFNYHFLHVNLFYNQIKDLIDFNQTLWQYQNISGKSTFKGVEISFEQALSQNHLLNLNYTYTDAKDEDGNRLANRPTYTASVNLIYAPRKDFTNSLITEYIGPRTDSGDTHKQTGRYFLAHLSTQYSLNKNWTIEGKIKNIFDKNYQEVDGYTTLGRSFYVGFKASF